MRTLALDTTEDADIPNEVALDEVVREAARLAARIDPDHPLDQKRNKEVLWELFKELGAAGVGQPRRGRRGSRTRFEFDSSVTCKDLRLAFDALEIPRPSPAGNAAVQREQPALGNPQPSARAQSLDRDSVVATLQENEEKLQQLGVTALSLFGSVARNEAQAGSGVDLLVTFREPITSEAFFAAKFFLEDLLGHRVDLLSEAALRDRARRVIEPELVRVA